MTYTALATLVILGDDLSRVDRRGIVRMVRSLQQPSGTYVAWAPTVAADTPMLRPVWTIRLFDMFLG